MGCLGPQPLRLSVLKCIAIYKMDALCSSSSLAPPCPFGYLVKEEPIESAEILAVLSSFVPSNRWRLATSRSREKSERMSCVLWVRRIWIALSDGSRLFSIASALGLARVHCPCDLGGAAMPG